MTTDKNEVFVGLQHENSYIVGGINLCGGGNKNLVWGNLLGLVFVIRFC